MTDATQLRGPERIYSGSLTEPARWAGFAPRVGDVILATPAKSGTTWTQSMIAMLLNGSAELPDRLGVVSPWIDANTAPAADVLASLNAWDGRRVVKTHTPADGWPVWEGVDYILVFRHPLEVLLSIRKHLKNSTMVTEHPLLGPLDDALTFFLEDPFNEANVDRDSLATIVRHFETGVLSDRLPRKLVLNYAAISRNHAGTVAQLDDFLRTEAGPLLQANIVEATAFASMKERATDFAPEASNNFWHDDAAFFAGGKSGHWRQAFSEEQIAAYQARFAELLPNADHRHWIETGEGHV